MGACATKPKVLKSEEGGLQAPVPPPKPTKEPVPAVPQAKEGTDVVAEGETKVEAVDVNEAVNAKDFDEVKEVVNNDKVDDEATNQHSLSNLSKENKKESVESDNALASPEPVEQETVEPEKKELLELEKQAPSSGGSTLEGVGSRDLTQLQKFFS